MAVMRRLAVLLVAACGGGQKTAPAPEPITATPPVEQPEMIPEPEEPEIPAPWTGPKLAAADAPAVAAEWKKAKNRKACSALAFAETGDQVAGAKGRKASFVGGWAVAWDKKGLPGTDGRGYPCARCGRSVYGVAGTGGDAADAPLESFPFQMKFSDGARAGYGPQSEPAAKGSYLAFLVIPGQSCLYNVWSELGQEHLELLLKNLRWVAGAP
jgi:hypothetical protein